MKTLFKYLLMCVPVAASLPLMTACSDDESTDPYDINYVYIYSPLETDNSLEYKGNGTFLTQIAPECDLNPVRCTKPAPERLVAHFAIDGSLVDDYNKKHGTGYTFLKSAELENASLVIEQGKYISADSLKVKFTDMTEFQSGAEKYILPIALTSVDGSGISISQNSKIFLTFTSTYKVNHVTIASGATTNVYYSEGKVVDPVDPSRLSWNGMFSTDWVADDDITLSLEINNNLIGSYNALHGTNCEPMPNVSLEHAVMHIRKGDLGPEETLALLSSDKMASLELDKDYLVPVCVTEVSGVGAGKNEDKSVCYLVFKARKLPNFYVGEEPVGTLLAVDDNWKVTVSGNETYGGRTSWTNLVTKPGKYIGYVKAEEPILLDMGEEKSVSSILVTFYYSYRCYGMTKIETSLDGVTYVEEECSLPDASMHVVLTRKLVQARYIRITYPKTRYSYGGCPTGLKIYTPASE